VREKKSGNFLISLFGDYILLSLCVYAISKKYLKTKRKTLFDLRFFHLSQGEEKGERGRTKREKQRKSNTLNRANSNSPGESIARERKRVLLFINRGKSPLFYKKQYQK
jgi:hypothetical protein